MYKGYEIINMHSHAFPDSLAERAMQALTKYSGYIEPEHNGTISGILEAMENSGIDRSLILSIATKPKQVEKINDFAAEMNKKYSKKLFFSGSLHYDYEKLEEQVKFLKKNNINVIKMHPEYQYFCPTNTKMFKIYELLIEYDIAMYFHCGWDFAFVGARSNPIILRRLRDKFPKLKIIAAHLGSFRFWEDVRKYLVGDDIFLEVSFTKDNLEESLLYDILTSHQSDKLFFGTDSPWTNQKEYVRYFIDELKIEDSLLKKILSENAKKFLGI